MKYFHRWRNLLLLSAVLLIIFMLFADGDTNPIWKTELHQYTRSDGCDVPLLNPWDSSVVPFLKKWPALVCHQMQHELTALDANGTLYIRQDIIKEKSLQVDCSYRCYRKLEGDDATVDYDDWKSFKISVEISCEFVEVTCKRTTIPHNAIYSNNHNRIVPIRQMTSSSSAEFKPNILLFVMDSVSHSNWKRSLPKSLKILQDRYKSYIFNGMTKVGDQSFPNAVAFLAGKTEAEFGELHEHFDNHPLIWNDFKKSNYTTFYAEDYPGFNLFYYLAKGFKHKPVDHYFRPFWLNVYGSYLHRSSTNLCYGNVPMHQLQLNYLSQYIQAYSKDDASSEKGTAKPFFALNWLTELGHDYMNQVSVGDEDIANFLSTQYAKLKDSFVFVLSDHGHRFDAIRETAIGRLEERLPFFSMHVPDSILEKYPQIHQTLQRNAKLLTTFWDFHVTLRDIIHMSTTQSWYQLNDNNVTRISEAAARWRTYSPRGHSLLRPLKDRTCSQADVPEEYCVCNFEKPVSTDDYRIERSAREMMDHINKIIKPYPQCATLKLGQILNAYQTFSAQTISQNFRQKSKRVETFRITVSAEPSGGLFEGLLAVDHQLIDIHVLGDVNRINRYGNQSICVHDRQDLRKFCFCSPM